MRTLLPAIMAFTGLLSAAETPALSLLVGNKAENSLAIVDPSTGTVLARVPTGDGPHEVAASADGKLAFVANNGNGQTPGRTLSVIDVVAQKELRKVDISPLGRPHGLAVADGKVYFTAEANRILGRYDPATNKIDWMTGTGEAQTHMVVAARVPDLVFTSNIGSDSISMIERGAVTNISVGKGPEAIDLSPDGKEVWTAHSRDGGVSVIDVATKKVVATIPIGTKRSNRLKFTPDGKRVLISDMSGNELIVLDVAARKELQRLKIGNSPEGILMAKDGAHAYVCTSGDNRIAVLDLKTMEVTGHLVTGRGPDGMAWADRR